MKCWLSVAWVVVVVAVCGAAPAFAADAPEQARRHYEAGLGLFDGGDREQALVEFNLALELFPNNDVVFMLAQCEYHLGKLKDARKHYESFLANDPKGALAETARLRIAAIDRRPSVFVINTVPGDVMVTIEGANQTYTGQAPNEFPVPKGDYSITVSRPNYQTQVRKVSVGVAETHPLFFKLDPVPGRLVVRTTPSGAALFVRGMRAENPYNQRLEPGTYEIYAEAENYESRRELVEVRAGEDKLVEFDLAYVQRSGRGDLITTWGIVGAATAATWVMDRVTPPNPKDANPASVSLLMAAAGVGAVSGGLLGARLTPKYIADNRSMYRIAGMTLGGLEGTLIGLSLRQTLHAGFLGGVSGLVLGTGLGIVTDAQAPRFGRVTLIQSAAVVGVLTGLLAIPAFDFGHHHPEVVALAGLNVGLAVGLVGAYAGDASKPGPSWQRVTLIDLAMAAGVFAGAVVGTIPNCVDAKSCKFEDTPTTTKLALTGGGLGFVAGWLLTSSIDEAGPQPSQHAAWMPTVTAMPTQSSDGRWHVVPALSAQGQF